MYLQTRACWTALSTTMMKAEEKNDKNWAHAFTDPGQTIACVIKAAENNPGINYTLDSAADVCTPFSLSYKETGWKTKQSLPLWADVFQRGWMEFFVGLFFCWKTWLLMFATLSGVFFKSINFLYSLSGGWCIETWKRKISFLMPIWTSRWYIIGWCNHIFQINFSQNGKLISKKHKREV